VRTLDKTIDFLTKQIEQLEAELADIASSEFDKQLKALTSIKGIGITLATALILTTGGFTCFDNAKQLSRFIGMVSDRQSPSPS
jgi:transposase